jgi:hypothetical protein
MGQVKVTQDVLLSALLAPPASTLDIARNLGVIPVISLFMDPYQVPPTSFVHPS